jgi:hypothetical protein
MLADFLEPLFRQIAMDPGGCAVFGSPAVKHWPRELLSGLERVRLIEGSSTSEAHICPGCSRACVMTVTFTGRGGLIQCNQTDVDYGLIELEQSELRQWQASRSRLIAFIARELKLSPSERDNRAVHIRLGTWALGRVRRAMALEFEKTASLRIGDAKIELSELMKREGERVYVDHEELQIRAIQSADLQLGGKRYQQSRLKQRHRAGLTALRDLRLQDMADQLKRGNPALKKADIAKALARSGEFGAMNPATVARIIRTHTKMRRKKFA